MNWLNLLTLILQAAETDLPLIEQIIDGVHTATPANCGPSTSRITPPSSRSEVDRAIQLLLEAANTLRALDPQAGSAPGPDAPESERAYEALHLVEDALGWLTPPSA